MFTSLGKFIKSSLKIGFLSLLLVWVFLPNFSLNSSIPNGASVYAQESASPIANSKDREENTQNNIRNWRNVMEFISSFIYIIIWPIIVLAGTAMDNQLIYGSFMNLDTYLWQIWQIVRNFSNFALWFLFLVSILIYNLSPNENKWLQKFKPQDIILKVLVAGVLINMSRFLVMAMVDLSTVLTYSLGGIPLSVMKEEKSSNDNIESLKKQKLLGINIAVNYWDAGSQQKNADDTLVVYRSYTDKEGSTSYIAPCREAMLGTESEQESFLLGRAFTSYNQKALNKKGTPAQDIKMEWGYCVYRGMLMTFPGLADSDIYAKTLAEFEEDLNKNRNDRSLIQAAVDIGIIYPLWVKNITWAKEVLWPSSLIVWENHYTSSSRAGDCSFVGYLTWGSTECLYKKDPAFTVDSLLEKANSYTGPFISLYSSLINYSYLSSGWSLSGKFVELFLNAAFAVMLLLPLLALMIVLLARIGILRLVIATSPFFVLIGVFKDIFWKSVGGLGKRTEHFSLKNLINLLLTPVFVSFALGIAIVFMTALKNSIGMERSEVVKDPVKIEKIKEATGVDFDADDHGFISIMGFIKLKYEQGSISFSGILVMLFGIAITWFLLFWAIKQTTIGKSIGDRLQKLWESTLWTIPIIPTTKWAGVGFWALKEIPRNVNQLAQNVGKRDRDTIDKFFTKKEEDKDRFDYTQLPKEDSSKFAQAFIAGDSSVKIWTSDYQVTSMFGGSSASKAVADIEAEINKITDDSKKQIAAQKLDQQVKELLDINKMDTITTFNSYMNNAYMKNYVFQHYDEYENKIFTTKNAKKYKIIKKDVSGINTIEAEEITTT